MVDAAALAERLGVSRDFVYEHKLELGGVALGTGPRPRLRFDPDAAIERLQELTGCSAGRTSAHAQAASVQGLTRRRPMRTGTGVALLPIRGSGAAS
jgi:hypothetical protein